HLAATALEQALEYLLLKLEQPLGGAVRLAADEPVLLAATLLDLFDPHVPAHREIHQSGGEARLVHPFGEQGAQLGRAQTVRRTGPDAGGTGTWLRPDRRPRSPRPPTPAASPP